jgi:hypothetical protein
MTIAEFHTEVKVRLDKMDSLQLPNILTSELDLFLNQAQDRIVKQRYGITNPKRQGYEESQKRTDDLKAITRTAVLVPLAYTIDNIDSNARFFTLPADYWFIVQERANITYPCGDTNTTTDIEVRPIEHNEFSKAIYDPFKKPNTRKVLRLMENSQSEIIFASGVTVNSYKIRYIKKPARMSYTGGITCELSDHLHSEIVDECVKVILENIESIRLKTFIPAVDTTNE